MLVRPVPIHDEDLVALELVASRLEDDPLAVRRPVGFGVLPAIGELMDLAEMRRRLR